MIQIKHHLVKFLFLPKFFTLLRFLYFKKKIRPYFGLNIFKTGGPYIRTNNLVKKFGNFFICPNIIYAQSYWTERELCDARRYSLKYNVPIIFNQNGWFYKSWYKEKFRERNEEIIKTQKISSIIIFQSKFCKIASKLLNNFVPKKYKIIYNCVPFKKNKINNNNNNNNFFLLSGVFGKNSDHVLLPALKAFDNINFYLLKKYKIKLLIAGIFKKEVKNCAWYKYYKKIFSKLEKKNICEYLGPYSYKNKNYFLSNINYALHLQYQDVCPNAVIERLNMGIIHIYSNSGGTSEIIGKAGIPIKVKKFSWNKFIPVNYKILSKEIINLLKKNKKFKKKIYNQSKKFNYTTYINDHKKIFNEYLQ